MPVALDIGDRRVNRTAHRNIRYCAGVVRAAWRRLKPGNLPEALIGKLAFALKHRRKRSWISPVPVYQRICSDLQSPVGDILYRGIQHIRNFNDAPILNFGNTLVKIRQILLLHPIIRLQRTNVIDQVLQLRISIALGNAHLTENYRAEVALTYHHRHCCVHQSAVTQEDKRFVQLYSLQPSKRIALKTPFPRRGIV